MSLQIGTTTAPGASDITSAVTVLSVTPSATLAKRVRGRIQLATLNSAGGILTWRVSVNGAVFGQYEQTIVAGDQTVCWETPVVTVPANGAFAVTVKSSNLSDTSVTPSGVCWSAEEADEEMETGVSLKQSIQRIGATTAGIVSGAGTGTEIFIGLDGVTERVRVTATGVGNRTAITYS